MFSKRYIYIYIHNMCWTSWIFCRFKFPPCFAYAQLFTFPIILPFPFSLTCFEFFENINYTFVLFYTATQPNQFPKQASLKGGWRRFGEQDSARPKYERGKWPMWSVFQIPKYKIQKLAAATTKSGTLLATITFMIYQK